MSITTLQSLTLTWQIQVGILRFSAELADNM
jgi:hypothetical protein